jgi:hypothetical protein
LTAEKKFWRCVETGETPHLFGVEPPRAKIEPVRTVDMSASIRCMMTASLRARAPWLTRLETTRAWPVGRAPVPCQAGPGHGVCKILGQEEIKPHKVRYYLERRDCSKLGDIEQLEKFDELATAVAVPDKRMDLAGE